MKETPFENAIRPHIFKPYRKAWASLINDWNHKSSKQIRKVRPIQNTTKVWSAIWFDELETLSKKSRLMKKGITIMPTLDELNVSPAPWVVEGENIWAKDGFLVHEYPYNHDKSSRMKHDAILISAVTDLYNACLDVYNYLSARQQPEAKEILRKALAKAAGKAIA